MRHEIEFEGGHVLCNLMPLKAVSKLAELAGGATDTAELSEDQLTKLTALLDDYVLSITINDKGVTGSEPTLAECPLPWGLYALEAMLDFSFPQASLTTEAKPSASTPATPTRAASIPTTSSS